MGIQIHSIPSEPFDENSYIVWPDDSDGSFVVDPGFEPELILAFLKSRGLQLHAILNTHGHVDHIAGNAAMLEAFPEALLMIGELDAPMLTNPELNLSAKFGFEIISPPASIELGDQSSIEINGIEMDIHHIPGHSPGHVVFVLKDARPKMVLGGDVLFQRGIGRTDFPGGSFALLAKGIRERLWPLDDDTIVFPGHGPPTRIGDEKRFNPYVGENAG